MTEQTKALILEFQKKVVTLAAQYGVSDMVILANHAEWSIYGRYFPVGNEVQNMNQTITEIDMWVQQYLDDRASTPPEKGTLHLHLQIPDNE